MTYIVQKFGGTSVADTEKILAAARKAVRAHQSGHQVVMVVSAMGKQTDELVSLASEVTEKQREIVQVLSDEMVRRAEQAKDVGEKYVAVADAARERLDMERETSEAIKRAKSQAESNRLKSDLEEMKSRFFQEKLQ